MTSLPTASDNPFASLLVTENAAPSSPASGKQRVYIDSSSHHLSRKNSSGTVVDLETNQAAAASTVAVDTVTTSQSTASGSYGDLATTGPSVSVTVPASGKIRVGIRAEFGAAGVGGAMTVALSVGNTQAAGTFPAPTIYNGAIATLDMGDTVVISGLTPGATTVTAKYKATAGTCFFGNRQVWAEPVT